MSVQSPTPIPLPPHAIQLVANRIRLHAVRMVARQGLGYLGQALSSAELMATLFASYLRSGLDEITLRLARAAALGRGRARRLRPAPRCPSADLRPGVGGIRLDRSPGRRARPGRGRGGARRRARKPQARGGRRGHLHAARPGLPPARRRRRLPGAVPLPAAVVQPAATGSPDRPVYRTLHRRLSAASCRRPVGSGPRSARHSPPRLASCRSGWRRRRRCRHSAGE